MLSALEQLQQDYSKRLDEGGNAFAEWRTMSGLMIRQRLLYEAKASKFTMVCQALESAVHDGLPADLNPCHPVPVRRRSASGVYTG
ncbi:MbeD family mobilization/exclusion protein [Salmonella enterica]|uniref:MbeD family mobilization/exclusion protein n=1 Tax=Salmonella enterica TaxID=28901 RepID=UPI001EE945BA